MRVGSQQNLMTVQRKVQVGVNKLREPNIVWSDVFPDVWCEVTARRGKEQFDPSSKQRFSQEVWHFRTRFAEVVGIDATMRVLHEGQIFDIKSVLPDAQKRVDCIIECTVADSKLQAKLLEISILEFISPATVGQVYPGFSLTAAGGTAPYVFSAAGNTFPPGMALDAGGMVSGTPTAAGSYMVAPFVTDAAGDIARLPDFEILVEAV